ncbi:MAG: transposase [Nitrosopumilaceae archaeon]|nr:transposase [Nitrosopumilaceae archaeon]
MVPYMHRYKGLRVCLTNAQARHIDSIRASQRFVYNWAVEKLLADPTLTRFDLQKLFTKLRNSTPHLLEVERIYQDTAIHQARTAADISNKYGNGNLKFRSKKRGGRLSVACDIPPRFMDNMHASFPGLGTMRLYDEQPYRYPHNWLHGARSFMLVDKTPKSWKRVKPKDRVYRLFVSYDMSEPEPAHTGVAAGLDRGITNPTVVCKTDGDTVSFTCYDTAVSFRSNQSWNDEARRTIQRRNKHSNSTKKMKKQRNNYNWHNANARDYAEWLLAKEICYGVDVICIENLDIEAMTRRGNASKRGLNRGLRYIRHHSILKKVRVVAERLGIRIVEVDPRHTSQECYVCSHREKENRDGEKFLCLACGRLDNADGNASANVVQRGTDIRVPAGGGIALERREMGRTRKPPKLVCTAPDAMRRRERQACNRPKTSSATKHLGRYAYVTQCYFGI